ncbi:MAG: exodeoxyribonuclease V subunit gamma [Bacteroidia bacterium]|nr:exodeoxyribonuclease V subunit gamma [Bacteroidia bacterium]MDW8347615.1 3'-5' exonuclease [Bacteroidia bacterium]
MDFLNSLNPPQKEAVTTTEGPIMVIAGAGSGKTHVLTCRIAYMLKKGNQNGERVSPFEILALTFTNKAAKEMRERIEKMVGTEARNIWMGTFHSIFARILRTQAEKIGFSKDFTIYDQEDAQGLIKTILKEIKIDEKVFKPNYIHHRISMAKNMLVTASEYQQYVRDEWTEKTYEVYKIYEQRLKNANAMDFDDLLLKPLELFRDNPDILAYYQNRFEYILVDEYQDTNHAQYMITRYLAHKHQNITVVGDDAQSIYSFRGANIQNILNFNKDFPNTKVIKLEQNYRSTPNILAVANEVIQKNKDQIQKIVWTENKEGDKVTVIRSLTEQDEANRVADIIRSTRYELNLALKDFVVLYRTNAQSRAIEEGLRKVGLPARVIGGMSFYQRKEIKDLIAYFRVVLNDNDETAFKRIINYPTRGIGEVTIEKILDASRKTGNSLWYILNHAEQYLGKGKSTAAIQGFVEMIQNFRDYSTKNDAYQTAKHIAHTCGLFKELKNDTSPEGISRVENVQELLNAIKSFVDDTSQNDKSLSFFLQEVSLLTSADLSPDEDAVTLMTIHTAKGLEFPVVFVVGVEEDLFPSRASLNSRSELEEERRLFYVAVTRAKYRLYISYAEQRYRYGDVSESTASRFIKEINPNLLNFEGRASQIIRKHQKNHQQYLEHSLYQPSVKSFTHVGENIIQDEFKGEFIPCNPGDLRVGMEVRHEKFGKGKITAIDGTEDNFKAHVFFNGIGNKTLLLKYAKLMIVKD